MQSFFARTKKKGVMKMKKIIVAGAGHGGIAAAALLAKQGYDVTVLELKKRAEMGHDWHDVMAKSSFEDAGFTRPEDGRFIPYTNTSYVAPSQKTEIAEPYKVSEWSGYIDRKELLKHLIGEAEKAGVAFRFGVKVVSVACDCEKVTGVRVLERGKIKEYAGDLVIDAAGIDSPCAARCRAPSASKTRSPPRRPSTPGAVILRTRRKSSPTPPTGCSSTTTTAPAWTGRSRMKNSWIF